MGNTLGDYVFKQDFETKLQETLDYLTNWKSVCNVIRTDARFYHLPYIATNVGATGLTRDTYFAWDAHAITDEYISISTGYEANKVTDKADLAQCSFEDQMIWAREIGQKLDEQIESAVLADYTSWTDFDNGIVTANAEDSVNITVDTDNVDDITGAMKREIMEANGWSLATSNGMFIIWRAADFEKLEKWARQNGYTTADDILVNGMRIGIRYMGVEHYVSAKQTSSSGYHNMGGVKKLNHVGLLNATYGQVDLVPFPVATGNLYSLGVVSRVDYGVKTPTGYATLLFDMQVN